MIVFGFDLDWNNGLAFCCVIQSIFLIMGKTSSLWGSEN